MTGKVHSVEQLPTLFVNDGKLKDPTDVANVFKNLCIIITEKLNIQQIGKLDGVSVLEGSFPGKSPGWK